MIGNKKCPYCGETLERGLISGPSTLYKEDLKYIGCAECGKTSILYKNGEVSAITAPQGSETAIADVIKKDIDKAFSSPEVEGVFSYDFRNKINSNAKKPVILKKSNSEEPAFIKVLENLMKDKKAGVMAIPADSAEGKSILKALEEKTDIVDDGPDEELSEIFKDICKDIIERIKVQEKKEEINKPTPKVETTELKVKENDHNEERHSYTLIDEYGEAYTYQNMTTTELLEAMEQDGHEENEYTNMQLYKLTKPLKFAVKKSVVIE